MSAIRPVRAGDLERPPAFDSELPTSECLPPLPFLATLAVCSGTHRAGLLHPAADHGIHVVSSSEPALLGLSPEGSRPAGDHRAYRSSRKNHGVAWKPQQRSSRNVCYPRRAHTLRSLPLALRLVASPRGRPKPKTRSPLPLPSRRWALFPSCFSNSSEEVPVGRFGPNAVDLKALRRVRVRCASSALPLSSARYSLGLVSLSWSACGYPQAACPCRNTRWQPTRYIRCRSASRTPRPDPTLPTLRGGSLSRESADSAASVAVLVPSRRSSPPRRSIQRPPEGLLCTSRRETRLAPPTEAGGCKNRLRNGSEFVAKATRSARQSQRADACCDRPATSTAAEATTPCPARFQPEGIVLPERVAVQLAGRGPRASPMLAFRLPRHDSFLSRRGVGRSVPHLDSARRTAQRQGRRGMPVRVPFGQARGEVLPGGDCSSVQPPSWQAASDAVWSSAASPPAASPGKPGSAQSAPQPSRGSRPPCRVASAGFFEPVPIRVPPPARQR